MAADPTAYRLDRAGDAPLGAQLAAKLRGLIEKGELAPGDGLPSLRAMARAAAVNVNTVRAVYSKLENDGIVQTEHGRGTYVARPGAGRERPPRAAPSDRAAGGGAGSPSAAS